MFREVIVVSATCAIYLISSSEAFFLMAHRQILPRGAFVVRNELRRIPQKTWDRRTQYDIDAARHEATSRTLSMAVTGIRRVVVTGMGIASCLGCTLDEVTRSLYESQSGITYSQEYTQRGIRSQIWGKPNIQAEFLKKIPKQLVPYCGDNVKYAFYSMINAIDDSGLEPFQYEGNDRAATIVGQGGPSLRDIVETVQAVGEMKEGNDQKSGYDDNNGMEKSWADRVGPYRAIKSMGSAVSAVLSTAFRLRGPSFSIAAACSTGAHCVGVGYNQIQLDKADIAFCGAGDDGICWEFAAMCDAMGVLSTSHNDNPTVASRPFDKDRDGFVMSCGGGIMVLEELEHAKSRGAKIYAEIVGYGATADGYDMVAPSGVGGKRCMILAINEANRIGGSKPVEYINFHATSTPVGDIMEINAIKELFKEEGYQPYVGSTKSLSGHAIGAAGIHEAIYTVLMMNNDFMAKSANIDNLMEEASGTNILLSRRDAPFSRALSNSFGFGGTNCVLMFDKYDESSISQ